MLAIPRNSDPLLRHLFGIAWGISLTLILGNLILIKALLCFLRTVAGRYDWELVQIAFPCGLQHRHQRGIDALIHFFSARQFDQVDLVVCGDRILMIHQYQIPVSILLFYPDLTYQGAS